MPNFQEIYETHQNLVFNPCPNCLFIDADGQGVFVQSGFFISEKIRPLHAKDLKESIVKD